jgi:arylsulfatase A-like enzyme
MSPPRVGERNRLQAASPASGWRLALAGALLVACAEPPPALRPDVLVISIDTLRADHTSLYGYERRTTPELERLAEEGVLFELAYAPTATTAPSHATLFTGRPPMDHGVERNGQPLGDDARTLAEQLAGTGYATAAFVSSFVLNHEFGFAQGFEVYDDDFRHLTAGREQPEHFWHGQPVPGVFQRPAQATTERALGWIDGQQGESRKPRFLFVHYIDPHEPYDPPAEIGDPFDAQAYDEKSLAWLIARYDALILSVDAHVGRLVDRFEESAGGDGALVIVTSDHGEGFLEHGWRSHGVQIYEEAVRIPLLLRWSGHLGEPRVLSTPASLLDLAPTVLGLLRLPTQETRGVDLLGLHDEAARERPVFLERQTYDQDGRVAAIPLHTLGRLTLGDDVLVAGRKFGVRSHHWKYLEALEEEPRRELYDLAEDPGETQNLAQAEAEVATHLSGLIATWRATRERAPEHAPALSEEVERQLEALGYRDPRPSGAQEPSDP